MEREDFGGKELVVLTCLKTEQQSGSHLACPLNFINPEAVSLSCPKMLGSPYDGDVSLFH